MTQTFLADICRYDISDIISYLWFEQPSAGWQDFLQVCCVFYRGRSCMAWASSHCSAFCREGRNQTPSELSMETKVLGARFCDRKLITNDIVMKTSDDNENMKTWQASRLRKRTRALQPPLKHVHTEVRGEAARSSLLSAGQPHHRHEKLQCKPLKSQNQDKHKLLS